MQKIGKHDETDSVVLIMFKKVNGPEFKCDQIGEKNAPLPSSGVIMEVPS